MTGSASPRDPGARAIRAWLVAGVYLAFAVVAGLVWEPAHDEGVTWYQAIGHPSVEPLPAAPVAIGTLYAVIDGRGSLDSSGVIERMSGSGGMHPPAYYLALHLWTAWVGTSRPAMAAPLFVLGAIGLFLLRDIARMLGTARSADCAMLFLAISPWFVAYSNLARPYALAVFLAMASTWVVLRYGEAPRLAPLVGFQLLSILGLYTIYHYGFVVAWQLVLLAVLSWPARSGEGSRGRPIAAVLASAGVIAVGFAPWLPNLLEQWSAPEMTASYFSGTVPIADWPGLIGRQLVLFGLAQATNSVVAPFVVPVFVALGAVTLGSIPLSFAGVPLTRRERLFWLTAPALPASVLVADQIVGMHTAFITKTTFALLPLLILLVVRAFDRLPALGRRLGLGAWTALLLVSVMGDLHSRGALHPPMEVVAAGIAARDEPSHVLVLSSIFPGYATPLLLNLRDAGVARVRVAYAPWFRLPEVVDLGARDPTIDTFTLLNLDVDYAPAERWRPEHLDALIEQATSAGWRVRTSAGFGGVARGAAPERSLRIVPPLPVKYFAF